MEFYNHMIYSSMDDSIHSFTEVKKWYMDLLACGDIDIEDYPTLEDYYNSLFEMGENNWEADLLELYKGYAIYMLDNGCIVAVNDKGYSEPRLGGCLYELDE